MKKTIAASLLLLTLVACNPSIEFFKETGESTYAMQTQETIDEEFQGFKLLPVPDPEGKLPRSSGKYHLLGNILKVGKEFRKGHLFYLTDEADLKRMRIFTRNGYIYRIRSYAHISLFPEPDKKVIFDRIEKLFGKPDAEILNERTYVDDETVVVFSLGGPFIITDMTEISEGNFPVYLEKIIMEKVSVRDQSGDGDKGKK